MVFDITDCTTNKNYVIIFQVMVDCRRSRGGGIEFKRAFLELKHKLSDVICESGNMWLQRQGLVATS